MNRMGEAVASGYACSLTGARILAMSAEQAHPFAFGVLIRSVLTRAKVRLLTHGLTANPSEGVYPFLGRSELANSGRETGISRSLRL